MIRMVWIIFGVILVAGCAPVKSYVFYVERSADCASITTSGVPDIYPNNVVHVTSSGETVSWKYQIETVIRSGGVVVRIENGSYDSLFHMKECKIYIRGGEQ